MHLSRIFLWYWFIQSTLSSSSILVVYRSQSHISHTMTMWIYVWNRIYICMVRAVHVTFLLCDRKKLVFQLRDHTVAWSETRRNDSNSNNRSTHVEVHVQELNQRQQQQQQQEKKTVLKIHSVHTNTFTAQSTEFTSISHRPWHNLSVYRGGAPCDVCRFTLLWTYFNWLFSIFKHSVY